MLGRILWFSIGGLLAVIVVVFLMIGGQVSGNNTGSSFSVLKVFAQPSEGELKPETVVHEENIYLCGDIEEVARKTTGVLGYKNDKELRENYVAKGFSLSTRNNDLLAQRKVSEFCSYHRGFRHLGVKGNKMAVFQGPIGYNNKLIRVEEAIPIQTLAADFQVKLQQGMDFFQMTPETQAKLRYELEFPNEDGLNAILENLDEIQD